MLENNERAICDDSRDRQQDEIARRKADRLKRFGKWVQQLRKDLDITQQQAAAAAGLSEDQWSQIERGKASIKTESIPGIAFALKLREDELFRKIRTAVIGEIPSENNHDVHGASLALRGLASLLDTIATKDDMLSLERRLDRILEIIGKRADDMQDRNKSIS